jgi:hypothetical protein
MSKDSVSAKEKIVACGVLTLGSGDEVLDEAYRLLYPGSQANGDSLHRQARRWWRLPRIKEFRAQRRAIAQPQQTDELDDMKMRSLVISELRKALTQAEKPSDRAQISIKLAEMVGVKGRKEEEEKNRRHFYLPFVSHCRSCPLMQAALELRRRKEEGTIV